MSPTAQDHRRSTALDDLLCFDLYSASRAVTSCYRPLLAELGLTYPQYLVVRLLGDGPARPVSSLARDLHLDHGTLTPLLRRLEASGMVTRTRSTSDERVVEIGLTAAGTALQDRFAELDCRIRGVMGLDETAARDLQTRLRALTAALPC